MIKILGELETSSEHSAESLKPYAMLSAGVATVFNEKDCCPECGAAAAASCICPRNETAHFVLDPCAEYCPDCGDPLSACVCKAPVKFHVAVPAPPKSPTRTALVYQALSVMPSRFQLAAYASKFARKVHRPGDDVAKTISTALERVAGETTRGGL